MDTSAVEQNGILSFLIFLSKSKVLKHDIPTNDKTPSWDGNISLYFENHEGRKEYLKGLIPIQVKSSNPNERKPHESFPISKSDLNNYHKNGGIILIRPIYYNEVNDYDIYIKILLPVVIEELLRENIKKINPNTGKPFDSISVELEKITDIKKFEAICDHFLTQRELQFNMKNAVEMDKVKTFFNAGATLRADTIVKDNKVYESLLDNNCFLYLETKDGLTAPIIGRFKSFNSEKKCKVKVNDDLFFSSITNVRTKNESYIKFNPNLILNFSEQNTIKFDLKQSKNDLFINYYNALKFLQSANKHRCFTIDKNYFSFSPINDLSDKINNTVEFYEDLKRIIDMYRIDYSIVTFNKIDEEEKLLEFLINTLLYGAPAIFNNASEEAFSRYYVFLERSIVLLFRKIEKSEYHVIDLLKWKLQGKELPPILINKNIQASRFLLLNNKNGLRTIDNFFEEVYTDLIKYYSVDVFDYTQLLMLNCIHVYDETNNLSYLNFAEKLNNYFIQNAKSIKDKDFSVRHTINQLQIVLRKRNLNSSEKRELINLKNIITDIKAFCCILILLGYEEEFKLSFEKLNNDEQKLFKSWPIYKLVK